MREIGGYLEFETYSGSLYHDGALALNCGRACLEYLIRAKGIRKIYIPFFCCRSVSEPCVKTGIEVEYYHIDANFRPLFDGTLAEDEWLYIVNYYGQISNEEATGWKERWGNIIFDNAQAFFQLPVPSIDTLYTCRKFFGVPDGAFLYTDAREPYGTLERDESFDHMRFVLGRFERPAGEFYQEASDNNRRFRDDPIRKMSKLTGNLLRAVDYDSARGRRTGNFAYLHERLGECNKLEINVPDGGYMYPFYSRNGAIARNALRDRKIFIPILWPDVLEFCGEDCLEYDYAMNILPLPIDQRYGIEDMEFMLEKLL